jgi:hypothetical protein
MKWVDWLIILVFCDLEPLGLYEEIDDTQPRARDSCTSYATENIDYLTILATASSKDLTPKLGSNP